VNHKKATNKNENDDFIKLKRKSTKVKFHH
jgi:hypothetical protein